ncbi:phosphatase PAP2 family protein, partial [Streptomyces rochei]|nr:phosphatase PAP2 family protein [Streptomyces rochei]
MTDPTDTAGKTGGPLAPGAARGRSRDGGLSAVLGD